MNLQLPGVWRKQCHRFRVVFRGGKSASPRLCGPPSLGKRASVVPGDWSFMPSDLELDVNYTETGPYTAPHLLFPLFFFFWHPFFFLLNMFVIDVNYSINYSKNKTSVCGSLCEW